MGGNAKAVYRNTGTVKIFDGRLAFAEKISFDDVPPGEFVRDTVELIKSINASAGTIWKESSLQNETMFFGSFDVLKQLENPETYAEIRKSIGDIDVAVPPENIHRLHEFLVQREDKKISPSFFYIGQNRQNFSGKKINCIFFYEKNRKFLQIDFESIEFLNEKPSEYCRFMRSSSLEDTVQEIKGLAHKYLLSCIARAISEKPNSVLLTDKSPLHPSDKIRIKLTEECPFDYVFGRNGLRKQLVQQKRMGYPVMVSGKYAYKECPKESCETTDNLKKIFKILFSRNSTEEDDKKFWSFVGLCELCEKYLSKRKIERTYELLVNWKLWGQKGQKLSRNSEEDRETKETIIYTFESKFPFLVGVVPLEKIVEEYYEKYDEREEE